MESLPALLDEYMKGRGRMIIKSIVILFLLLSLCNADSNVTTLEEPNYIDETHATLSKKVVEWSDTIDKTICSWVEEDETNVTAIETNIPDNTLEKKIRSIDAFFQSSKYLNEIDDAFIRLRTSSFFQSKDSNDFNLRLSIQLPLSKSKKSFKIFMDDLSLDNAKSILKDDSEKDQLAPDMGIHYFAPETYGIESRYSLGLSGIDPFVKARYNFPFQMNEWMIDPVQVFKYSTDDEFEEETNIYFDKQLDESSLFRVQLHRKTQTEIAGMDYALSLQYYWVSKKNTGLRITQSFLGNTKYPYITDKNTEPTQTKTYAGINNYITSFSWRKNVWRKWFYYEVRPSVNFHKQYDYDPNYSIHLFFDFYFGQYH
jgi:hypothetical protein